MKKIEAITKPYKLDAIKEALVDLGIEGMTVSEVRDLRAGSFLSHQRSFQDDYLPRLKLEIVVRDELVEEAVNAIQRSAAAMPSDQDGTILVEPVENSLRIRTGEKSDRTTL
ncbi:MAG: P-II family nitrogen regulator [Verrucomicrobiia bacterium]